MKRRSAFLLLAVLPLVGVVSCSSQPPDGGDMVINEYLPAPQSDVNCDGVWSGTTDEFIELVSTVSHSLDLGGVTVSDSTGVVHTFPSGTELGPHQVMVLWGGGTPSCSMPTGVTVKTASTGSLSLSDDDDTITIKSAAGTTIDQAAYSASKPDVSWNRDPDVTGSSFRYHDEIAAAAASKNSPGRKVDGTQF